MNKGKRNIQPHANKEVKHLMVLLDKSQASEFRKMVPELQELQSNGMELLGQKLQIWELEGPI